MKTLTKMAARFEVKAIDAEKRTFTGLAATWDEDLGGDVIEKGSFKKTISEWKAGGKVMPLIDQHNYGSVRSVVGKMTAASETDAGLECDFEIIDGPDGDEVLRRVKGGFVDGLSIGYEAVKWEMEEADNFWGRIRRLKEVRLVEVSVVIWPMNPNATIDTDSVKAALMSMDDDQKKEFRALLGVTESVPAPEPAAPDAKMNPVAQELLAVTLRQAVTRKSEPTLGER